MMVVDGEEARGLSHSDLLPFPSPLSSLFSSLFSFISRLCTFFVVSVQPPPFLFSFLSLLRRLAGGLASTRPLF